MLWVATSFSVGGYQHFGATCRLHFQGWIDWIWDVGVLYINGEGIMTSKTGLANQSLGRRQSSVIVTQNNTIQIKHFFPVILLSLSSC
jgi:hypothetical protein